MYPQTEEPREVAPVDLIAMGPVADIYEVGGGAELLDDYSYIPIQVERKSVVPLQQGVAAFQRGDNGKLRNRTEISQNDDYGYRVFALTLVHNGPEYTGIIQHVMQENAEQFSIHNAQTPALPVDLTATLPYNSPDENLGVP